MGSGTVLRKSISAGYFALSTLELNLLRAIANGMSVKEIAEANCLSEMAVNLYFQAIGSKLQARNITHAVALVTAARLIEVEPADDLAGG